MESIKNNKLLYVASIDQFDKELVLKFINQTKEVDEIEYQKKKILNFADKTFTMSSLFFQPSTRTKNSFEFAALKLGIKLPSGTDNPEQYSSVFKGEDLYDTIFSTIQTGADVIVLRHPEEYAMNIAIKASNDAEKRYKEDYSDRTPPRIPILNGGSGKSSHPTQALLDIYTIYSLKKRLSNITVGMVGDLKNGRTVRSLCKLLSLFEGNEIAFLAPKEFQMKKDILEYLDKRDTKYSFVEEMSNISNADIVYMTRIQKEWLNKRKNVIPKYIINKDTMRIFNGTYIMHPLPRNEEISKDVDSDPRSKYFMQMRCGLLSRMTILKWCLDGIDTEWRTA